MSDKVEKKNSKSIMQFEIYTNNLSWNSNSETIFYNSTNWIDMKLHISNFQLNDNSFQKLKPRL